jgi:hypothetical protein
VLYGGKAVDGIEVRHDERSVHVTPTKAQRKKTAGPVISLDMIFEGARNESVAVRKNARSLRRNRA